MSRIVTSIRRLGRKRKVAHHSTRARQTVEPGLHQLALAALEEEVDAESFNTHDTLEPRIWNTDENTMKPIIRDRLMKIAQNFIDELPVEVNIEDITLTGSLANFNWSNYSDVDLHIIVDFLGVDENRDLIKSFFDNARMKWNNKHEIRVKGYDVEVYVEGRSRESCVFWRLFNIERRVACKT